MSGELHMYIDQATPYIASIGAVGRTLTTGWQGAKTTIDGASGGLGGDALGQAFASKFLPASETIRQAGDLIPAAFEKLHAGGNQAVERYTLLQTPPALRKLLGPSA